MNIYLFIIGLLLSILGSICFILFQNKINLQLSNYINQQLLEYKEDVIIPDDVSKNFIQSTTHFFMYKYVLKKVVPLSLLLIGVILLIVSFFI